MCNKYLSRKVCLNVSDGNMVIEYYLIENEKEAEKTYGIEITKKTNGIEEESECIEYISGDIKKTEEILEVLAVNEVTPISLRYIIDDILE